MSSGSTPTTSAAHVVLAPASGRLARAATADLRIEAWTGPREELRPLFALAEDSAAELDSYLHAGRVLVARIGQAVVGHLQLVETDRPGRVELKNMAVWEARPATRPGSSSDGIPLRDRVWLDRAVDAAPS
jgi:hypothetical protein